MVARTNFVLAESGLTQQEEMLCEALMQGMPLSAAGRQAGYKYRNMKRGVEQILQRPVVKSRLQEMQQAARNRAKISLDDVLTGFQDAINDAKLLGDPGNQIAGWRELAKVLGYYAPETKKVEISHKYEQARQQLADMSEEELLKLAGDNVIDGEFRVLGND